MDYDWLKGIFGFVLVPYAVFYLEADLDHLVPRVLSGEGFDYWGSGMNICAGDDIYENYRAYQMQLLEQFRAIGKEYKFTVIDANRPVQEIFVYLRKHMRPILKDMWPAM